MSIHEAESLKITDASCLSLEMQDIMYKNLSI